MYNQIRMDLNEIIYFTRVVQAGSFTQAARRLGVPKSTVSAKIASLERRLGVTLLRRTTRKLNVTEAGELYFRECAQAIEEIETAESKVTSRQASAQGTLKITAPVELGAEALPQLVERFLKSNPQVRIELVLTDRLVDLVGEGIDLAIRAGALPDSSLIARKIGDTVFLPVASPAYLRSKGSPAQPRDLADHECLLFTTESDPGAWELFTNKKQKQKVRVSGKIAANDFASLKAFAIAGLGIALLPISSCENEIRAKKLIRVLPEWHASGDPVYAVYPAHRYITPKLQLFVDLLGRDFAQRYLNPSTS